MVSQPIASASSLCVIPTSTKLRQALTLVKLISLTFVANENWILTGIGEPYELGDLVTDDGCKQRYKQMKLHMDNLIKDLKEEDLKTVVETYSYFVSFLLYPTFLKEKEKSREMFKTILQIVDTLEKLLMHCKVRGLQSDNFTFM